MSPSRPWIELQVLCAQAADERAFAAVVAHWHPAMVRHARRYLADEAAARDAVQDAWCAIVRGLAGLDDPARFPAWALQIVTRHAFDLVRRGRRGGTSPADPQVCAIDAAGPAAAAESNEEHQRLRAEVQRLDLDHRVVVELHYLDGLSLAEVGDVLELPLGTVKSRLFHARQRLRAALDREPDQTIESEERP
ncbi:MAG TPA: sigma-70 family RNA polymerase sigma factor [Planctomycetota bacterium]|nr:sigma-70 family RNA polymerase sigma factor [Planctomycetota bacterium]